MPPLGTVALSSLAYGSVLGFAVGRMTHAAPPLPGLSRKVFHVGVFSAAVPAHVVGGFWGVVIYGFVVSGLVLLALARGPGFGLYHALARDSDGAEARNLVIGPLLATALGGMVAVLLVGDLAVVGYLVCGWGDAAGELVGRRMGKRRYRLPYHPASAPGRTLEGSGAVFLAGTGGAWVALLLLGTSLDQALAGGLLCGLAGSLAEGLSGRGSDNFWTLVVPSLAAWAFLP